MSGYRARAAIITTPGEGGIGIIALAGPDAVRVLDKVFAGTKRNAEQIGPGRIAHGTIRREGQVVDEVIVARYVPDDPGADEPYFEVNCHGGIVAVRAVLNCLEKAGARIVDPHEFAAAAPDVGGVLSPAAIKNRAVAALPQAPTRLGAAMLLHQAAGALSRQLGAIAGALATSSADDARQCLDALVKSAPLGRALLEPPTVALLGPPNAGKSTLLNALLEQERVIVHHEPGTTRDVVAETVSIRGVPFRIRDAAGIRPAQDDVERQAVSRAEALMQTCDVALLVCDVRDEPDEALGSLPTLRPDIRAVVVANKIDLLAGGAPAAVPAGPPLLEGIPTVCISAKEKINLDHLESELLWPYRGLLEHCRGGGAVVFDGAIEDALANVRQCLDENGPDATLAALRSLGVTAANGHENE